MSTETELRDWRYGPIQAERLCAAILAIDGFTEIDPQATLGGGDDKKDILARKHGELWVAAVYFPPTEKRFADIKSKFAGDFQGVERHKALGLVFFVNKQLTLKERADLRAEAEAGADIYHLERIRHVLDTPAGYGVRLEYLRIPMTAEEQISFFSASGQQLAEQLLAAQRTAPAGRVFDQIERTVRELQRTVAQINAERAQLPSSIAIPPAELTDRVGSPTIPMAALSVGTLSLLHRALLDPRAAENAGQLRSVQVWIGDPANPTFIPPGPEDVPRLTAELVDWWRREYFTLAKSSRADVVAGLARLHHGVTAIHPYLDGNGRLARVLVDLAAQELLAQRVGGELTGDRSTYFSSLRAADEGDLGPLEQLIEAALT